MTFKVMTLNLWNKMGPYEQRRARVREWVERLDPDVIGFQEALRHDDGWCQVTEIVDGLGYNVDHAAGEREDKMQFGNAVASRYPITKRKMHDLPAGERAEGRCALNVTIAAPFGDVSFTVTHLNWKLHDARSRELQVVDLAKFVLSRRPKGGFPPIVVGDFNADPDSTEIRFFSGFATIDGATAMFYDAWRVAGDGGPGITWSNDNDFAAVAIEPDRRIDYIFAGYPVRMTDEHGLGKILSCRVVCNDEVDGVWPSDHYGLFAEFASEPLPKPSWAMG